jgi:hypothetical protein
MTNGKSELERARGTYDHLPGMVARIHERVAIEALIDAKIALTRSDLASASSGAFCLDCGLTYDDPGFCDLVVSDEVWRAISPTGHEGGLLCPTCMCRAARKAGLEGVAASFRSGPFASAHTAPEAGGETPRHEEVRFNDPVEFWRERAEAAQARIAELERERDEAVKLRDQWFGVHDSHRQANQHLGEANSKLFIRAYEAEAEVKRLKSEALSALTPTEGT